LLFKEREQPGVSLIALPGKRSKGLTIMLLPLLMIIFVMGFCMSCLGEEKRTSKNNHKRLENDQIRIMPIVLEEQEAISV